MIDWFMGLTINHQGMAIGLALVVVGLIFVIIGAYCQHRMEEYRKLQQKQERAIGKTS